LEIPERKDGTLTNFRDALKISDVMCHNADAEPTSGNRNQRVVDQLGLANAFIIKLCPHLGKNDSRFMPITNPWEDITSSLFEISPQFLNNSDYISLISAPKELRSNHSGEIDEIPAEGPAAQQLKSFFAKRADVNRRIK